MDSSRPITRLLADWRHGDEDALARLLPLVYEELRGLAGSAMRAEPEGHTLQPTSLVHEAYLRLFDADIDWNDRVHFYAVASRIMRRILIDHARGRRRHRRGGGAVHVSLGAAPEALAEDTGPDLVDFIALDRALDELAAQDERKAQALELRLFGGLNFDEIGAVLDVSGPTVHRDVRFATAWLHARLQADADPPMR